MLIFTVIEYNQGQVYSIANFTHVSIMLDYCAGLESYDLSESTDSSNDTGYRVYTTNLNNKEVV